MATQPTPSEIEWLKVNYKTTRIKDIANKFIITEKTVSEWLKLLGLKKEKRVYVGRKKYGKTKEKKINTPIIHLSHEYSNITRDQHIDRILNMQL